jgi:ATP-dependent Clp protease ATP-binding subunit ClpA
MSDQLFLGGLDLTPRASQAIQLAHRQAQYRAQKRIEPLHILLGIILLEHCEARLILERNFGLSGLQKEVRLSPAKRDSHSELILFTHATRLILTSAKREASRLSKAHPGTEHILLGILAAKKNRARTFLVKKGVHLAQLRRIIET